MGLGHRHLRRLPAACLGLYAVLFVAKVGDIAQAAYLNADVASGPVIASVIAERHGTGVVLGNYPWYEALGALRVIAAFPAHRWFWQYTPLVVAVATVGLVVLTARTVMGRERVALVAVALLAAGPQLVIDLSTWTIHGLTWLHVAVLGAYTIWMILRSPRPTWEPVAVGLLTAPGIASDALLYLAGLAPMAAACLYLARRTVAQGVLRAMLITVAVAVTGGVTIGALARSAGYRAAGALDIGPATPADWPHHLVIAAKALAALGNGDVFNTTFGLSVLVHAACIAIWATALVCAAVGVKRSLSRPDAPPIQRAYAVFWMTSALLLLVAFVMSTVPQDVNSARYLVAVLFSVAALAPLGLPRRASALDLGRVAVAALCLAGVVAIGRGELDDNSARFPGPIQAEVIANVARRFHVTRGYGGYWTVTPINWLTRARPLLAPVRECGPDHALCRYDFHTIGSWYRPEPGRSLLVIDPTNRLEQVTAGRGAYGPPIAEVKQAGLVIEVYARDIASFIGAPLR